MLMQSIEEGDVVDLTSDNGKDWRQIEDFQDLPAADELLNLRKARASSKASIEPRAWTESRSPTVSKTPTTSKLLQSKQRATEQQEEVEEDENTRTPTPATRELPRLKLTLSLKKDRRVMEANKPPQSPLEDVETSSPVSSPPPMLPSSPSNKRSRPGDSPNTKSPGRVRNSEKAAEQRARGREEQRDPDIQGSSNGAKGKGKSKGRSKGKDKDTNVLAEGGLRRSRRGQES
jgi:hypothetical protein